MSATASFFVKAFFGCAPRHRFASHPGRYVRSYSSPPRRVRGIRYHRSHDRITEIPVRSENLFPKTVNISVPLLCTLPADLPACG